MISVDNYVLIELIDMLTETKYGVREGLITNFCLNYVLTTLLLLLFNHYFHSLCFRDEETNESYASSTTPLIVTGIQANYRGNVIEQNDMP